MALPTLTLDKTEADKIIAVFGDADTLYQPVFNFTAKTFPAAGNVQVNGNVYWDGSLANAAVYTFTAVWLTTEAWPTSLPGTP